MLNIFLADQNQVIKDANEVKAAATKKASDLEDMMKVSSWKAVSIDIFAWNPSKPVLDFTLWEVHRGDN